MLSSIIARLRILLLPISVWYVLHTWFIAVCPITVAEENKNSSMPNLIALLTEGGEDGTADTVINGGEGGDKTTTVIRNGVGEKADIVTASAQITLNSVCGNSDQINVVDHKMAQEDEHRNGRATKEGQAGDELVTAIREGVKNIIIKRAQSPETLEELEHDSDVIDNKKIGAEESGDVSHNKGSFYAGQGHYGPIGAQSGKVNRPVDNTYRRRIVPVAGKGLQVGTPIAGQDTPPRSHKEYTGPADTYSGSRSTTSPNQDGSTRMVTPPSSNTSPRRFYRVWRASPSARSGSTTGVSSEFTSSNNDSHTSSNDQGTQHSKNKREWSVRKENAKVPRSLLVTALGNSFELPILYVSPSGVISVILNMGIIIEITADRAIRLVCHDKFSAACNGSGTSACLLHEKARVFRKEEKVFCTFNTSSCPASKCAVIAPEGVLFTMSHLADAYLVSSTAAKGTSPVPAALLQFPNLNYDFTLRLFYAECQTGEKYVDVCNEIVRASHYGSRGDATLLLTVNDVYIKQDMNGNCEVNSRPRHISCSPSKGTIRVRTDKVDMAVQEEEKAYVKRGLKRVHVSRSGMVASDGSFVTSMDHLGRIVSST